MSPETHEPIVRPETSLGVWVRCSCDRTEHLAGPCDTTREALDEHARRLRGWRPRMPRLSDAESARIERGIERLEGQAERRAAERGDVW